MNLEFSVRKGFIMAVILLFTGISQQVYSQKNITWETLKDVKFTDKWSEEFQAYYQVPKFGAALKALDGKEVIIKGYIIPIDVIEDYYVLSANPYSSCFFCGQAGPESVMEVQLKKKTRELKMDQVLTFKGKLKLNAEDIYQLNYILENAEVVD
jgi:hypothetical protein